MQKIPSKLSSKKQSVAQQNKLSKLNSVTNVNPNDVETINSNEHQ